MLQIKETLKKRGIKQNDLAKMLGINRVSLSRLLSDKNDMRVSTIKKIADALGLPVGQLFDQKPQPKNADHSTITCPYCGEKLVINLSVSDKKHE